MSDRCTAGRVGRGLRLLVGIALLIAASRYLYDATVSMHVQALVAVGGLVVFYVFVHIVMSKYVGAIHHCFGAAIAIGPVYLVFALGGAIGQLSALLFVGLSLLVAAARADAGCEVMSIPSLLFGRSTHLFCIVFSPVDWVEERLAKTSFDSTQSGGA